MTTQPPYYWYFLTDRDLPYFLFGTTTSPNDTANYFQTVLVRGRFYAIPMIGDIPEWELLNNFRELYQDWLIADGYANKLANKFYPEALDNILDQAPDRLMPQPILSTESKMSSLSEVTHAQQVVNVDGAQTNLQTTLPAKPLEPKPHPKQA